MFLPIRRNKHQTQHAKLEAELREQLGPGPMRFGPVHQKFPVIIEAEAHGLSDDDIEKFGKIKVAWETTHKKDCMQKDFNNGDILRVAIFCGFDKRRTLSFMRKIDPRHFHLSAMKLGGQLRTRTLFPCPGLKTRSGSNVFYMRPSRFIPKETPTSIIIDNLIYVMDHMFRKDPLSGISLLANMEGWKMSNFNVDYCRKFMNVIQGKDFPAKVDSFFILNPPSWFGKIWKIMKPMLAPKFRERVHMIREDDLFCHMDIDFEEYLPDEVRGGKVDTGNLVRDFVLFQQAVEQELSSPQSNKPGGTLFGGKSPIRGFASRRKKIEAASLRSSNKVWKRRSLGAGGPHGISPEEHSDETCTTRS